MTSKERVEKLRCLITCMKCEVSGKECDNNCPTQYDTGNMGEIIENLEEIAKALEQEPCEDKRLYIKVFADLEPDDIAEKIYQICDEDKFPKVIESLKEYFDSEPCKDAIRREDALMALTGEWTEPTDELIHRFIKRIRNLPPVNPKPKTGRWIYGIDEDTGEKDLYAWTCSECEGKYPWQPKYCPNCGAKMESEDVEDKGEREDRATRKRG